MLGRRVTATVGACLLLASATACSSAPSEPAEQPAAASASASPTPSAQPATFTVTGKLQLRHGFTEDPPQCAATGGYKDIENGGQVTVTDATGKVVAVGELGEGFLHLYSLSDAQCEFSFRVDDVPTGSAFYGVEVTHRGVMNYRADKAAQPLALTLG